MAGDHCEMCAPFYYGKVIGLPGDCTPCTCPHRPLSAAPVSWKVMVVSGALPASLAMKDSRCSTGYRGNPCAAGGSCQKYDCNPQGSVHSDRDHTSGQMCLQSGATGLCCEECQPRHILMESDYVSCDDECVGALLNDLDTIGDAVLSLNLTGVSSAPYGILSSLENTTKYFQPTPKFGKANSYEKLEKLEGPFATLYKGKSK
ncbi:Laminin subunit alpha-1 [Lemmus lemmus]